MKKKILLITTLAVFSLASSALGAEKTFLLYGYKIGQPKNTALKELGKPVKVIKFKDGFITTIFQKKDHYVYIQSDNRRPDLIWAIQIQGKNNPHFHGLGDVNLGDPISKVIKTFGKPDSTRTATDEETKQELKGIIFYSYYQTRNFSIEITNGIVTSIKVIFNGPQEESKSRLTIKDFVKTVQSGNLNRISRHICTNFSYYKKKPYQVKTSFITALKDKKALKDIFFNKEYGITTITPKDIIYSAMRLDQGVGQVYRIKKKKMIYELYIVQSYEGYVLRYINLLEK